MECEYCHTEHKDSEPCPFCSRIGWDVAIRLEENRVHIAEWITGLSTVVIGIAAPLFLGRVGNIGNEFLRVFTSVLFVMGVLFAATSLGLGIWYYVRYMDSLYLNPCHLQRELSQGGFTVKSFSNWSNEALSNRYWELVNFLPKLLQAQLLFFCFGIGAVLIAIVIYSLQVICA